MLFAISSALSNKHEISLQNGNTIEPKVIGKMLDPQLFQNILKEDVNVDAYERCKIIIQEAFRKLDVHIFREVCHKTPKHSPFGSLVNKCHAVFIFQSATRFIKMSLSFIDLHCGLSAIHHCGFGLDSTHQLRWRRRG